MVAAGVQINLKDESSYIPSGSSVFAGIAGAFKKGPLEPVLCTSQAQFLKWFAPEGKPKIGYPQAYQSALDYLADADALWVVRATKSTPENPLLYGALVIMDSEADSDHKDIISGVGSPDTYNFGDNEAILVTGSSQGSWTDNVYITYTKNESEGLSDVYDLRVYTPSEIQGEFNLMESFLVSRNPQATDGYGNNIYLETVVNGNSNYIAVRNNIDNTNSEKEITQPLYPLTGGSDGEDISSSMTKISENIGAYTAAIDKLANIDEIPLQLLLDGGIQDSVYANHLMDMAGKERLGECFCVLSTPETVEGVVTNITDYRTSLSGNYSYLASLYTPHVRIYDRFNDRYVWNAPDGMVAGRINAAIRDYGYNFPAAGYTRGILSSALDVKTKFMGGDLDLLDSKQINVIKNDTTRGIVIMGNSTLHKTASDKQDQNNMLVIGLQIKPGLREFLKDYLFDLNDEITRSIIVSKINLFMKDVKAQRGVSDFYVVCDGTNNSPNDVAAGVLNIDLYVKMVKAIKFIKANIVATAQGLDFSEFS